jgi:hypothetical protein
MFAAFRGDEEVPLQELWLGKITQLDEAKATLTIHWWHKKLKTTNWRRSGWDPTNHRPTGRGPLLPYIEDMPADDVVYWGFELSDGTNKMFQHDTDIIDKKIQEDNQAGVIE